MANIKVVVGLGNPGAQYENTPHSVGFEAVDKFAAKLGLSWELKRAHEALEAKGNGILLVKPQTFMNLSGNSVAPIVKYSNATAADLIVVQDDIDLPLGKLRVRKGGSCGGHNGVRNIIERLASQDFVRVKIGVGRDKSDRSGVIAHVLGKFSPENRILMSKVTDEVPSLLELLLKDGPDKAMNKYNGWQLPQ